MKNVTLFLFLSAALAIPQIGTAQLTLVEELTDGGMDQAGNTLNELDRTWHMAISADNKHLYLVSWDDAITVFSRNTTTGVLTLVEELTDGGMDQMGNSINELSDAYGVVLSTDDKYVYVTGEVDDGLSVFSRNTTTGVLTLVEELTNGGMDQAGNAISGLIVPREIAVSPDNNYVYVGIDNGIFVFSRNLTSGILTLVEKITDGGMDQAGNMVNSLDAIKWLTVSPDNQHLYASARSDDGLSVFSRNTTTGVLTLVEELTDGGMDQAGNVLNYLREIEQLYISPDNKYVYITGEFDDGLSVFSRNTTTGVLTLVEELTDGGMDQAGNTIDGLNGAQTVVVTTDRVYVGSSIDDAVAVFSRNSSTGVLTYLEVHKDNINGITELNDPEGLAISPDGKFLYATGDADDGLVVFEAQILLALSGTATDVTCNGADDGSINITPTGGDISTSGQYTYEWRTATNPGVVYSTNEDLTGLVPDTYNVTVTDDGSGMETASYAITEPAALTTTINVTKPDCNDPATWILKAKPLGGTGSYTYNWTEDGYGMIGLGSDSMVTGVTATHTYYLTVTDANNCTATASMNFPNTNAMTVSGTATDVTCIGLTDGSIDITLVDGTTPYTFNWENAANLGVSISTDEDPTGLTAGTYNVTVTDASSCTATNSFTVGEPTAVSVAVDGTTNVSCVGDSDGAIMTTASGGTVGTTVTPFFTEDFESGTYNSLTDQGSGSYTYNIVTTDPAPNGGAYNLEIGGGNLSHFDGLKGSLTSSPISISFHVKSTDNTKNDGYFILKNGSGALAGTIYFYCRSDGNLRVVGGINTYNTPYNNNQWYFIEFKNIDYTNHTFDWYVDGVLIQAAISFRNNESAVNEFHLYNFHNSTAYFDNLNLQTATTTTYTYNWENAANSGVSVSTDEDPTGLAAGTYNVTVTDGNGCTGTNSFTVGEPTAVSVAIDNTTSVSCVGGNDGAIMATASGGTVGTTVTPIFTEDFESGTYNSLTDQGNGYTYNVVTTNPAPTGDPSNLEMTGGVFNFFTGLKGNLTNSPTDISFHVKSSDSTRADGYFVLKNSTVNNFGAIVFYCSQNAKLTVIGSTSVIAYETPFNYNNNKWYYIEFKNIDYTNHTFDWYVDGVLIHAAIPFRENLNSVDEFHLFNFHTSTAYYDNINLQTATTTTYTYNWENAANSGVSVSTDEDPTGLAAGTYNVTVTDGNGCTGTGSATISTLPAIMIVEDSLRHVDCNGNSTGAAHITVSGGTPSYTFSWSNGGGSGEDLANVPAGTYTLTVTDANGCMENHTVIITEPAVLTVATASTTNLTCNGNGTGAIDVTTGGGTMPYKYNWENAANSGVSVSTDEDPMGLAAGTYQLTVTDAKGCTDTTSAKINEPTTITITIDGTTAVSCNGGSDGAINITATGGTGALTYAWDNGVGAVEDPISLAVGTYTVTVTDANGCMATKSAMISEPSAIVIVEDSLTHVDCNGNSTGAAHMTVSGGTPSYTFAWDNGGGSGEDLANVAAGTYTLTVTDANGCMANHTVTITEPTTVTISAVTTSCSRGNDGNITITATGGTGTLQYSSDGGTTYQLSNVLSGLAPGNHIIKVKDANQCETAGQTVEIEACFNATLSNTSNVSCLGGNDGSATLTIIGRTPYTVNGTQYNSTPILITGLAAGTHTLVVSDSANINSQNVIVTITQPSAAVTATAVVDANVTCNGVSDGGATVGATGGTPGYSYLWSNGATTASITNVAGGTYSVTVTDANGCTDISMATITEPNVLTITENAITNVDCNSNATGAIDINVTGGTSPFVYSWVKDGTSVGTTEDLSGLVAGTYQLTVTDANNCMATKVINLTEPDAINSSALVVSNYSGADISCFGASDGIVSLSVQGNVNNHTYSIDGVSFQTSNEFNGLAAGTYTFTVKAMNGCTDVTSITLTQPSVITANVTETATITCNGGTDGEITVAATGGVSGHTYSLDNLTFQSSPIFTGLGAGTYTIHVKDANGCTTSEMITLSEPDAFTATAAVTSNYNGADVSGAGATDGEITVTPTNGVVPIAIGMTYDLQNGGSNTTGIFTGLGAGVYNFIITDANGCTTTASATITDLQPLVASASTGANVNCNGGTDGAIDLTVDGGLAPYTFAWDNGAAPTEDPTGLGAGTYTVTVTDVNGNMVNASATITEPTALTAPTTTLDHNGFGVSCVNATDGEITVNASGGTAPLTYSIHSGVFETSPIFGGLGAGTYAIVVKDANGCEITTTATVTSPTAITATASVATAISCEGASDGVINVAATGGAGSYQYSIDGNVYQSTGNFAGLGAGFYTFWVKDINDCVETTSITLIEPNELTANATATNVSCNGGSDGAATVVVTGGTTPYTYLWNDGGNQTTATAMGLNAGTYMVIVTDANGCNVMESVTITAPTPVTASAAVTSDYHGSQISCNGGNDGIITVSAQGGTGNLHYSMNGSAYQSSPIFDNLAAGTYNFSVQDDNGCIVTTSATLTETTAITGTATVSSNHNGSQISCAGGSNGKIMVNASGGTSVLTYSIDGVIQQTSNEFIGLSAGTYTITVFDANGCSMVTNSVTLIDPSALSVTAVESAGVACFNTTTGEITATATGGTGSTTYSIDGTNFQTSPIFSGLSSGTYSIVAKDVNGCTEQSANVTLANPAPLSAFAVVSANVSCNGGTDGSITITGTGGTGLLEYSVDGTTFQTSNVITGLTAGSYTVSVKDANGCIFSTTPPLIVNEPTAITAVATVTSDYNGAAISCVGATDGSVMVTAQGGTGTLTYSINGGTYQATGAFSGLGAGTHTINVKDVNDCILTTTVTIDAPTAISVTSSITGVTCAGGTDGAINATGTGGTGDLAYSIDDITYQMTGDFAGLMAGTYTVFVKDENGCKASEMATISEPTAITISASETAEVSCHGGADGEITAVATGGTGTLEYSIDGNIYQSTGVFAGLMAGTYTVFVKDANDCVVTVNSVEVTQPGILGATIDITNPISCNGANDGMIEVTGAGGQGPYTYLWNTGATTTTLSNLSPATYSVIVTDANGCTMTESLILIEPDVLSVTLSGQNVSCNGGTDGVINASIIGGTAPYTYAWQDGSTTIDLSNVGAGTYALTITDAHGCTANGSTTITEPTVLTASASATSVSCHSGTDGAIDIIVLGGTVPYTYQWDNGATTEDLGNLGAGTYAVTITDANGCIATTSATITEPTALQVAVSGQNVTCNGDATGSATATATGGTGTYTYAWSGGQTTATASNLATGTYTITVTDANSCTVTESVTITEPTAIVATATVTTNVDCNGNNNGAATVTVTGGTGTYTYAWSGGQTTSTANNLAAGTHTVTVTDANNCIATQSVTITEPATFSVSLTQTAMIACQGDLTANVSGIATGGTTPYAYAWSNGVTTADLTGVGAGTYMVTVTDNNGCTTTETITITEPTTLAASAIATNVSCAGTQDGSIDLTVTGGTVNYTYAWSNNVTTEDLTNVSSGTYIVTVTDANGCTTTVTAIVGEPTVLTATATAINISCNGANDGSVTLNVQGGTTPYTYAWDNSATSANLGNLGAGTYSVTVTDANNCTISASATVTEPAALVASIVGTDVQCIGSNTGAMDLTVTGGTAPYTYVWSNNFTTEDLANLGAGTYTVTVTDINGCQTTQSATIVGLTGVSVSGTVTNITCFGANDGQISVTATNGLAPYTYAWSDPFIGNSNNPTNLGAGNYNVTVTDANGCTAITGYTVIEPQTLTIATSTTQAIFCNGGTGSVNSVVNGGTAPYTVTWVDGLGNPITNTTNLSAGLYTATVVDGNGCSISETILLDEPTALVVSGTMVNDVSCNGGNDGSITINATGGIGGLSYVWSTTNGNGNAANNLTAGNYSVTITDGNGCTLTATFTINEPTVLGITATSSDDPFDPTVGMATATASGGTNPYGYQWGALTGNQTGATATNLNAGTYSVTVTDGNGCTATTTVTVQPTNTTNFSKVKTIEIFPNPTSGKATINIELSETTDFDISVYAMDGRKVVDLGNFHTATHQFGIDVSDLPSGIYLIRFMVNNEIITKKLVLTKN